MLGLFLGNHWSKSWDKPNNSASLQEQLARLLDRKRNLTLPSLDAVHLQMCGKLPGFPLPFFSSLINRVEKDWGSEREQEDVDQEILPREKMR